LFGFKNFRIDLHRIFATSGAQQQIVRLCSLLIQSLGHVAALDAARAGFSRAHQYIRDAFFLPLHAGRAAAALGMIWEVV